MYIFTKKKFYFIFTAVIALILTIVLVGCNFTTYGQDAKYIIGRVWCFDKIIQDQPSKIGEFRIIIPVKGMLTIIICIVFMALLYK